MAELTMYRGDDRIVTFTFDGDTTFAEGDVVRFTVKSRSSDADADAILNLTSTDSEVTLEGGVATAEIPSSATNDFTESVKRLYYDWQLTAATGKTRTLDTGTIIVVADIARTAP